MCWDEGKQHVHRETTEPQNVSRSHIRDLGGRKEESLQENLGTFSQARGNWNQVWKALQKFAGEGGWRRKGERPALQV